MSTEITEKSAPLFDRAVVLRAMQTEVREVNEANGWFDTGRTVGDDIALLHSEASEALEAYRDHGLDDATGRVGASSCFCRAVPSISGGPCRHPRCDVGPNALPPKPEGFGSELADVLIRLLDTCERRGVNLAAEYERKVAYNRTRGHRHGGKNL